MAFPNLDRLKSQLLSSGIQQKNQPLYQVINQLIDALRQTIDQTITATGGGGGGGGGLANQHYLTHQNDQVSLPFSRELVAGSGISLHKTPTKVIINANPLLYDAQGNVIEMGPPGPKGDRGEIGPQGIPGSIFADLEGRGEENQDLLPYPVQAKYVEVPAFTGPPMDTGGERDDFPVRFYPGGRFGDRTQMIYGDGTCGNSQIVVVNPGNPTATTSLTSVMMGLGSSVTWTPIQGGRTIIFSVMNAANNTANDGILAVMRSGTGTAPANGTAASGTQRGASKTFTSLAANAQTELVLFAAVAFTPFVTNWFDIAINAVTGGTASITSISFLFFELP